MSAVICPETETLSPTQLRDNAAALIDDLKALADAAESFLASEYQQALETLLGGSWKGDRQRYHALVLQAASRYSLYVLGGEQEQELYDQAVADIRAIAEIDSRPSSLAETFFSPRFREFFATTLRATLAQSEEADNS